MNLLPAMVNMYFFVNQVAQLYKTEKVVYAEIAFGLPFMVTDLVYKFET
jgi:hypothetical protein